MSAGTVPHRSISSQEDTTDPPEFILEALCAVLNGDTQQLIQVTPGCYVRAISLVEVLCPGALIIALEVVESPFHEALIARIKEYAPGGDAI